MKFKTTNVWVSAFLLSKNLKYTPSSLRIYFRDSIYPSNLHWKKKTKENLLVKSCVSLLTCYWNNSDFKNTWSVQSCYCCSLSFRRSAKIQSSQAKALEILYCIVTSFHQQSHHMSSCSSLTLFFLPVTSYRATSPPCFMPRRKVHPFQGPQTAWFRTPFLFSWSFKVCFSVSAASVHWFCPQNGPQMHVCITLLHTYGSQELQRTGFSEPLSWISHLTPQYPQIFPQRRTSSGAVWSRSFLEASLHLQL